MGRGRGTGDVPIRGLSEKNAWPATSEATVTAGGKSWGACSSAGGVPSGREIRTEKGGRPLTNPVAQTVKERLVRVAAGSVMLDGNLSLRADARAVVLFAHVSGSSLFSSRNRYLASLLLEAKLATLLINLLTSDEEAIDARTAHLRFDIGLLARRLVGATDWLTRGPATRNLPIGYFGASTGAAAVLVAGAERHDVVGAVVSRGGRPDLAGPAVARVRAPRLLIVGKNDIQVIQLNRAALKQLRCEKQLAIVLGATHLFEERGALDEVARLAREWFHRHLLAMGRHATGASR